MYFILLPRRRPSEVERRCQIKDVINKFNNCPTICDLFSLLHFCRQLYMFRVLTPIIRSWYSCNYSFWYWLTGSTAIRARCWVGTQQRERMVVDLLVLVLEDGSRSTSTSSGSTSTSRSTTIRSRCWVGTQKRERMVIDLLVLVLVLVDLLPSSLVVELELNNESGW